MKFPTAAVDEILNALITSGKSIIDSRNGVVTPRIRLDMAANQTFSIFVQVTIGTGGGTGLAGKLR
ncbi:MAG TPA: hypothetical protein VF326_04670 [Anaerolineaceae bacterium]